MADVDITLIGTSTGPLASNSTERPITMTSAAGTLAGHYLLVFASIDSKTMSANANPGINTVAGVTWTQIAEQTTTPTANTMNARAWLGQVTTNGQKTVSLTADTGSRLFGHCYTLDPNGGTITVDGLSSSTSVTSTDVSVTHASIDPAGTKDMLWALLSLVAFGKNPVVTETVPSMTVGATLSVSSSSRSQAAYQTLSAAGATGTRTQGWSPAGADGALGLMFALRSQTVDTTPAAPTVNAGADAGTTVNSAFLRTATESANNSPITARAWTIVSGPTGTGTTIGTAAALSWTPTVTGTYTLRYSATNSVGTSTDDVVVTVSTATGSATVTHQWLGIGSVAFKTVGSSTVRVGFSTSSSMSAPLFSAAQTPASGITKHTFPALTPGTTYYYQAEQDGGFIGTPQSFVAPPAANVPTSFSFGVASCLGSDQSPIRDFPLASDVTNKGARFFIQAGDIHYQNVNSTNAANYRSAWDDVVFGSSRTQMKNLMKSVPMAYTWDDHDYCGDGSNGGSSGRATAQQVFRERVPHTTLPSANGVYQTFVVGRVRIILLDCRSYRTVDTATDNGSKTMLGSEQITWLTNLLPTITQPLTFIVSSVTWNEVATSPSATNTDAWGKYTTERAQIVSLLQSASNTRIAFLCGDWHGLGIDDGSNAPGRFPTYLAAAMQQYANGLRGGPWSHGSLQQASTSDSHYGLIDVVDDGVSISWEFRGIQSDTTVWNRHSAGTIESGRFLLAA